MLVWSGFGGQNALHEPSRPPSWLGAFGTFLGSVPTHGNPRCPGHACKHSPGILPRESFRISSCGCCSKPGWAWTGTGGWRYLGAGMPCGEGLPRSSGIFGCCWGAVPRGSPWPCLRVGWILEHKCVPLLLARWESMPENPTPPKPNYLCTSLQLWGGGASRSAQA